MTVSSEVFKNIYTGNGSTTVFPYTFRIFQDADLAVVLQTIATGAEVTLTLTADYTVSNAGNPAGGDVTTVATYAATHKIIIRRDVPYTQETDFVENDPFPADSHEDALDKDVMLIQQLKEQVDRAILQVSTATDSLAFPLPLSDAVIAWNTAADALVNITNPAIAAAASAAAALVSENNAATSETNAATSETNAGTSETNAATSETNADLNRQYAEDWAITVEDTVVPVAAGGNGTTDFSALHWAAKAAASGLTTFTALTDTPANFTSQTLKSVRVNAGETALEFFTPSAAADVSSFNDLDVKLLLHGEGVNAGQVFVDSSAYNARVAFYGNAQTSTAQKVFGESSILFDGTLDRIVVPTRPDFTFGTGDFKIDFRVRFDSVAGLRMLFEFRTTNAIEVRPTMFSSGTDLIYYTNGVNRITGTGLAINTWYAVRVSRVSGTTRMFIDGVQAGSDYTDANDYLSSTVSIGADALGSNAFAGYIDEFRIVKGVGDITAYTPETSAYFGTLSSIDTGMKVATVTTTLDLSSTANLTVTGVGFTPKAIHVFAGIDATTKNSVGFGDRFGNKAQYYAVGDPADTLRTTPSYCVHIYTTGSDLARWSLSSLDAFFEDGLVLTPSKVGAPTGTADLQIMCIG